MTQKHFRWCHLPAKARWTPEIPLFYKNSLPVSSDTTPWMDLLLQAGFRRCGFGQCQCQPFKTISQASKTFIKGRKKSSIFFFFNSHGFRIGVVVDMSSELFETRRRGKGTQKCWSLKASDGFRAWWHHKHCPSAERRLLVLKQNWELEKWQEILGREEGQRHREPWVRLLSH